MNWLKGLLITTAALALSGCEALTAYNSHVAARQAGYDGKTISYRVEYR